MAHLIDKDALVAEIRSRLHPVVVPPGTNYDDWDRGADNERLYILSIIDALEVKEVDLTEEIYFYIENSITGTNPIYTKGAVSNLIEKAAKHFFELGLKVKQN